MGSTYIHRSSQYRRIYAIDAYNNIARLTLKYLICYMIHALCHVYSLDFHVDCNFLMVLGPGLWHSTKTQVNLSQPITYLLNNKNIYRCIVSIYLHKTCKTVYVLPYIPREYGTYSSPIRSTPNVARIHPTFKQRSITFILPTNKSATLESM